ncbi:MAG TPA: diguanylate cyclase, partial [Methylotenera sp.]|nr:diguanylate cyclase [Methylotenera sp.]
MRIINKSLHQQIVLLLVSLVLLTTVAIQLTSWWSARTFNNQQIQKQIDNSIAILSEYSQTREEMLISASSVLTADFGFKQAVATADKATLKSMLQNHGGRINADLMLLTTLQGELIASSGDFEGATQLRKLENSLEATPNRAQLAVMNDKLYQVILQPVLAPRAIAYTLIGFELDQQILNKLTDLTMMDLSFLAGNQVLLTSLNNMISKDAFMTSLQRSEKEWFFWSRPAFINTVIEPLTPEANPVSVILTADLRPIYKEYDGLAIKIVVVAALIMLGAIFAGQFFANRLVRPITRLVSVAKNFSNGNYTPDIDIGNSSAEIRTLSNALVTMGHDIQKRENEITFQADHDGLTGLINARKMRNTLESVLPTMDKSLQIVFYIENFPQINDQLGPEFADACLKIVAERLESIDYPLKQFHARMDGIEFISVLQL